MATSLPVGIQFQLPEGWQSAVPDKVGAPGAAFVAVHLVTIQPGFATNITIDGHQRSDTAPLSEIADESITRLRQASAAVSLAKRTEFGSADAPGLTQVLRVSKEIHGKMTQLAQCQVYLSMSDTNRPNERGVIRLALTATEDQFNDVVGDFQEFVRSVQPESRNKPDTDKYGAFG